MKTFGSKEAAINFCFLMIKNEMEFINKVFPTSESDNTKSIDKLEVERSLSIKEVCHESKIAREKDSRIKRLIQEDKIGELSEIIGERVLEKRISGYGLRSDYSWEDVRLGYDLTKSQLRRFRMSDGYRNALRDHCLDRVRKYKDSHREKYPDEEPPKVSEWFNREIIRKAGALGFTEPDYSQV